MEELRAQLNSVDLWMKESDRHMTKVMPVQIAGLMYEAMKKNIRPRARPNLHDNFKEMITALKEISLSNDTIIPKLGNLSFAKHEVSMPEFVPDAEPDEESDASVEKLMKKIKLMKKKTSVKMTSKMVKDLLADDKPNTSAPIKNEAT